MCSGHGFSCVKVLLMSKWTEERYFENASTRRKKTVGFSTEYPVTLSG